MRRQSEGEKIDDMFSRFDTIPECRGRKNGRNCHINIARRNGHATKFGRTENSTKMTCLPQTSNRKPEVESKCRRWTRETLHHWYDRVLTRRCGCSSSVTVGQESLDLSTATPMCRSWCRQSNLSTRSSTCRRQCLERQRRPRTTDQCFEACRSRRTTTMKGWTDDDRRSCESGKTNLHRNGSSRRQWHRRLVWQSKTSCLNLSINQPQCHSYRRLCCAIHRSVETKATKLNGQIIIFLLGQRQRQPNWVT